MKMDMYVTTVVNASLADVPDIHSDPTFVTNVYLISPIPLQEEEKRPTIVEQTNTAQLMI